MSETRRGRYFCPERVIPLSPREARFAEEYRADPDNAVNAVATDLSRELRDLVGNAYTISSLERRAADMGVSHRIPNMRLAQFIYATKRRRQLIEGYRPSDRITAPYKNNLDLLGYAVLYSVGTLLDNINAPSPERHELFLKGIRKIHDQLRRDVKDSIKSNKGVKNESIRKKELLCRVFKRIIDRHNAVSTALESAELRNTVASYDNPS